MLACVALVGVASYIALAFGAAGAKWLSPIAGKIISSLMDLPLAALAIQSFFNGVKGAGSLFVR